MLELKVVILLLQYEKKFLIQTLKVIVSYYLSETLQLFFIVVL